MQEFSTQILNSDNNGWGKITLPPLVAPSTKRKIYYSVITAHLLFIGIPLAVMNIMNWINPQPPSVVAVPPIPKIIFVHPLFTASRIIIPTPWVEA